MSWRPDGGLLKPRHERNDRLNARDVMQGKAAGSVGKLRLTYFDVPNTDVC